MLSDGVKTEPPGRGPEDDRSHRAEIVLVGGGLAGSALAALLARRGRDVVLFERDHLPRDKLCGEFLSGESYSLLQEIGCLEEFLSHHPPEITRARFTSPSGFELQTGLPSHGFGIRRRILDDLLLRHAARAGARVFEGASVRQVERAPAAGATRRVWEARVQVRRRSPGDSRDHIEEWSAPLVVGAYGRRDGLDKSLDRPFLRDASPHVGMQSHLQLASGPPGQGVAARLERVVEIHTFEGGYCGLNLVETGAVNVCLLLEERLLKRCATRWPDVLAMAAGANPALAPRLEGLRSGGDGVRTVAQVPFSLKERSRGSLLFAGDAAGMIAPLCGDGQAMALRSATLLAELIVECWPLRTAEDFDQLATRWDRLWWKEFGLRLRIGRILQRLALRRATAEIGLRTVRALPGLARLLTRATRGSIVRCKG